MRIVIDLKREGSVTQIKNLLFKHTAMRSTFSINMMAIVDGAPRRLGLKRALELFIDHRREVIRRRTEYQLEKARDREHVLAGPPQAIDLLDVVIATIRARNRRTTPSTSCRARPRASPNGCRTTRTAACGRLTRENPFDFSEIQARAILDMQLRRLAALERNALQDEYEELIKKIAELEDLLANPRKIDFVIRDDIQDLKKKYGDDRRTEIVEADPDDFREEDLSPTRTASSRSASATTSSACRLKSSGPRSAAARAPAAHQTREEDAVMKLAGLRYARQPAVLHRSSGKVYHLRGYDVPDYEEAGEGPPDRQPDRDGHGPTVSPRSLLSATTSGTSSSSPRRHGRNQEDAPEGLRRSSPQRQDRHEA